MPCNPLKHVALICAFLFYATPTHAAAFCLTGYGLQPQCLYDDVSSCLRDAEPPSTNCSANPDAVLSYVGGSSYCLVTSAMVAECNYVDRSQCNSEASSRGGVCVDRSGTRGPNDPFLYDNRVQN